MLVASIFAFIQAVWYLAAAAAWNIRRKYRFGTWDLALDCVFGFIFPLVTLVLLFVAGVYKAGGLVSVFILYRVVSCSFGHGSSAGPLWRIHEYMHQERSVIGDNTNAEFCSGLRPKVLLRLSNTMTPNTCLWQRCLCQQLRSHIPNRGLYGSTRINHTSEPKEAFI